MENRDKRSQGSALGRNTKNSAVKENIVVEGPTSTRWNDTMNRIFIQLCVDEIGKGNRPNSHFNVSGWNNLVKNLNEKTGRNLLYKQIRNHWDAMKKEWLLFKKLMHSETGIGWNPLKNSLDASDEWWNRKISEHTDFKKFKNKDLSLVWFEYDKLFLFSDVAATGERARAPSQRSINEIGTENEILQVDEVNEVEDIGDSDDIGLNGQDTTLETNDTSSVAEKHMFPSVDSIKRKYSGKSSKSKKVSGAASLKEDIHTLLNFMENKKSSKSKKVSGAASLKEDIHTLLNDNINIITVNTITNYKKSKSPVL